MGDFVRYMGDFVRSGMGDFVRYMGDFVRISYG